MENEDRTYSPSKSSVPGDNAHRAFYNVGSGSNPRMFSEALLPYHMTGYPMSCVVSSFSTATGLSGLSSQAAMSAPSTALPVHMQSAMATVQGGALHVPTPAAINMVQTHSQISAPFNTQSTGPFHAESQPSIWSQSANNQTLPDVVQVNQQQNFQRLKVEDALSYLDQVKLQFSGYPQVYNDFLDIMKEFKSQSIDTPGVITRVSNLFRGHPDLIVGFNTFLPPGYKIEVQANETISVHQPGQQAISLTAFQGAAALQQALRPAHLNTSSALTGPRPDLLIATQPVQTVTATPPVVTTAAIAGQQPVEFNHAIQYVNKIKQCYQNQPEIYKSFLDILHLYQKEQKVIKEGNSFPPNYRPLSEIEVYAKVTELFKDQPQLLAEFSQFLPDAGSGSALMSGFSATAESSLAKLRAEQSDMVASKSSATSAMAIRSSSQHLRRMSSASGTGYLHPAKKPKPAFRDNSETDRSSRLRDIAYRNKDKWRRDMVVDADDDDDDVDSHMVDDSLRKDMTSALHSRVSEHHHRMRLLDHVSRSDFNVELSVPTFEERLNTRSNTAYIPDLSTCRTEGASYRQLPKSHVRSVCSGRTELCDEVLNDSYVLYPMDPKTKKRENGDEIGERVEKVPNISSNVGKKNLFDEHMFQSEDERYELDVLLEVNSMAKTALQNVSNRIKSMSQDEATKFKLDDKLGSNSEMLMQIAIGRLYGDNTQDIINGLKCNPAVAVPVVLKRIVSKEKEWRDAQKEFNRTWREQDERYYLKSLDHQATKFKQSDVKRIRSKSLLREIEVIAEEVKRYDTKMEDDVNPGKRPLPYLTLGLQDALTSADAVSLILHHTQRQAGLQIDDRTRIRHILLTVLPKLLHFQPPTISDSLDNIDSSEVKKEDGTESSTSHEKKPHSAALSWLKVEPVESLMNDNNQVTFYGNEHWYLCLRLFVLLCERLQYFSRVAGQLTDEESHFRPLRTELVQQALTLRAPNMMDFNEAYVYLLEMVRSLLDGSVEVSGFEEQLRDIFGSHAYVAYTLDKLVQNIGRQLQHIVAKDVCWQLVNVFESLDKPASLTPIEYQKKVEEIIGDENCFKIISIPEQKQITVELIEYVTASSSDENIDHSSNHEDIALLTAEPLFKKPTFLSRNMRKVMELKTKQTREATHSLTFTTVAGLEQTLEPSELLLVNTTSTGVNEYSCGALSRAKQNHPAVSRHMSTKFHRWLAACNVTMGQSESFRDWLHGKVDGLKTGLITVCHEVQAQDDQPPYHNYTKYNVVTSDIIKK